MKPFALFASCVLAAVCVVAPFGASGQIYPSQPVRAVSDSAPGAPGDVALRVLAEKMGKSMGQPVIVEPRRGAGGQIAAMEVMKTGREGYAIFFSSSQILASKFLLKNQRVDIEKDMEPISQAVGSNNFFAVHKSVPANSLKEFVEYAKQNPNQITYSTNGIGSSLHMAFTAFQLSTGTQLRHVPYSSGGNAARQLDFFTGRVLTNMLNLGAMKANLEAGDVRPLAMLDDERNPKLPNVPAITEVVKDFKLLVGFYGFWGTKDLDRAIVNRLSQEVRKASSDPETNARLDMLDIKPIGSTPQQFAKKIADTIELMAQLVKESGIKPR